jgi:hypothetical protein
MIRVNMYSKIVALLQIVILELWNVKKTGVTRTHPLERDLI